MARISRGPPFPLSASTSCRSLHAVSPSTPPAAVVLAAPFGWVSVLGLAAPFCCAAGSGALVWVLLSPFFLAVTSISRRSCSISSCWTLSFSAARLACWLSDVQGSLPSASTSRWGLPALAAFLPPLLGCVLLVKGMLGRRISSALLVPYSSSAVTGCVANTLTLSSCVSPCLMRAQFRRQPMREAVLTWQCPACCLQPPTRI
mmetsp:Transcript_30123/g.87466  ORF Transcript_30123/g.87466 Transcript_30123/m.87466 type:complete len:203 (-) Transcript_30123:212-820(-)